MIPWDSAFPGLLIDPRAVNADTLAPLSAKISMRADFIWASRTALQRIASKPVGRDLLSLISKRCRGIGATGPMTCHVMLGEDTLLAPKGSPHYAQVAFDNTYAAPSLDMSWTGDALDAQVARIFRRNRLVEGAPMAMSGGDFSALVCWNPFIDYNLSAIMNVGVPMPQFIALAHELVHALHILSGDRVMHADKTKQTMLEEARTIGCGLFEGSRISENAIRREHGIARRQFYATPGDCDAANLA